MAGRNRFSGRKAIDPAPGAGYDARMPQMPDTFNEAVRVLATLVMSEETPRGVMMTRGANGDVVVSLISGDPDVPGKVAYARVDGRTGALTRL